MRNFRRLVAILCFVAGTAAFADHAALEQCATTDAKCVGRVLLNVIQAGQGGGSRTVTIYGNAFGCPDHLVLASFMFSANPNWNEQRCRNANDNGLGGQWAASVKVDGKCTNLQNANAFLSVCLRFI